MLIPALLSVLILHLVNSLPNQRTQAVNQCDVSEWSEWAPCVSYTPCGTSSDQKQRPTSFSVDVTEGWDRGRDTMMQIMYAKGQERALRESAALMPDKGGGKPGSNNVAYPATCQNGAAAGFACNNVDLVYQLTLRDFAIPKRLQNNPEGNDLWGWHDTDFDEYYILFGLSVGTAFVRITDPANPMILGLLVTQSSPSIWRDIKTVGNTAYICSEASNHAIQVFDLTRLRSLTSADPKRQLNEDTLYTPVLRAHNLVANEGTNTLYAVGSRSGSNTCNGGLHIIDVSSPLNPTFAGCFSVDGYTHDAQCVVYNGTDTDYIGQEICFAFNEDSLTIVNVDNRNNLFTISKTAYTGALYTHQGWLTEDHQYLMLDDEFDEYQTGVPTSTYIFDVSDLDAPVLANTYLSSNAAIDHNQYIVGDWVYQANYEAGLQILKFDRDSASLRLGGYFDTYTRSTSARYNGAWGNYPWLPDGLVAVSDQERGLFLLQPNYAAMTSQTLSEQAQGEMTRFRNISHSLSVGSNLHCPEEDFEIVTCIPKDC